MSDFTTNSTYRDLLLCNWLSSDNVVLVAFDIFTSLFDISEQKRNNPTHQSFCVTNSDKIFSALRMRWMYLLAVFLGSHMYDYDDLQHQNNNQFNQSIKVSILVCLWASITAIYELANQKCMLQYWFLGTEVAHRYDYVTTNPYGLVSTVKRGLPYHWLPQMTPKLHSICLSTSTENRLSVMLPFFFLLANNSLPLLYVSSP